MRTAGGGGASTARDDDDGAAVAAAAAAARGGGASSSSGVQLLSNVCCASSQPAFPERLTALLARLAGLAGWLAGCWLAAGGLLGLDRFGRPLQLYACALLTVGGQ